MYASSSPSAAQRRSKSTPTHVTASDKVSREAKSFAEVIEQGVDVLATRDAAEKHDFCIRRQLLRQSFGIALQWFAITRIVSLDIDFGELT